MASAAVAVVVACLVVAVLAGRDGLDGVQALVGGVHGTVSIRECTPSQSSKDPLFWTSPWNCSGSFTGDDPPVHIDHVEIFVHADSRPGPTTPGRVSGPTATWVWPDGEFEWAVSLALAAGLPVMAWFAGRAALYAIEPTDGWPRKPKRASPRPNQTGNRARRRRR